MSILHEILLREGINTHTIRFYREGVFYKAYERSAYLFVCHVKPFLVKKKRVKSVEQEVVSIGFPTHSIAHYFEQSRIKENGSEAEVEMTQEVDVVAFETWKQGIELTVANQHKSPFKRGKVSSGDGCTPAMRESDDCAENEAILKLKLFPIEVKTPLDCMLFLSELKKML